MPNDRHKVLVVDDDPHVFELVQLYVEDDTIELLQAMDAYAGLDLVLHQRPDLIVLDVMMPGMNGLEMCRTLRKMPKVATIPVIILSAKVKPHDIKAGYQAGADHYITKPFEPQHLAQQIQQMLLNQGGVL